MAEQISSSAVMQTLPLPMMLPMVGAAAESDLVCLAAMISSWFCRTCV